MRMIWALVIGLAALSGCEDPPSVPVQSSARQAQGHALCLEQCGRSRHFCSESCHLDYRGCYDLAQQKAERDYDRYAARCYAAHLPSERLPGDFAHLGECEQSRKSCLALCSVSIQSCYAACNGPSSLSP